MSCIVRDNNGNVEYALAENGERSVLFDSLLRDVPSKAEQLYAVTQTEDFTNDVIREKNLLEKQGVARQFDKNREVFPKDVYDYINRVNMFKEVTKQDRADMIKVLVGFESTDDLFTMLNDAFYNNGLFSPTKKSLKRNGYTDAEINNILSNVELQEDIKDFIRKVGSLSEPISVEYREVPKYRTVSSMEVDRIGRYQSDNPYRVQQAVIQELGGIKNREEFMESVYDSGLDFAKNDFDYLSRFTNVPVFTLENGELIEKPTNNTKELFTEVLTLPSNTKLEKAIDYFLRIPNDIIQESPEQVETLLEDIKNKAIDIGVDLENIIEKYNEKGIDATRGYLIRMQTFVLKDMANTERDIEVFAESHNEFFDISSEQKIDKVLDAPENSIKVEAKDVVPFDMFVNHGLLYTKNDVYRRVDNTLTSEQAIEIALTRIEMFPQEIFKGVNMTKRDKIQQAIEGYIKRLYSQAELGEKQDLDLFIPFAINSLYFGTPINKEVQTKPVSSVIENPIENTDYLVDEFIADLNKEIIKEKHKNSPAYRDFYSNLQISSNGIDFIHTDPISISLAKEYMSEDLKNYFRLKKDSYIDFSTQEESFVEPIVEQRNFYYNFPNSLPLYNKPTTRIDSNTISSENETGDFIRLRDGVYERNINNVFSKLPQNPTDYLRTLETNYTTPRIEKTISLNIQEKQIKQKKYFTKETEPKIEC